MMPLPVQSRHVLIPVVGRTSGKVLANMARLFAADSEAVVDFLRVDPMVGAPAGHKLTWLLMEDESLNRMAAEEMTSSPYDVVETSTDGVPTRWIRVESPEPAEAILQFVADERVDLVVLSTHTGRVMRNTIFGGVAIEVARWASCPVLSIPMTWRPDDPMRPIRRILAPVDFSDTSREALAYAVSLAERLEGAVSVVHVLAGSRSSRGHGPGVGEAPEESALLEGARAALTDFVAGTVPHPRVPIEIAVRSGGTAAEILGAAAEAKTDLTVIDAHGETADLTFALGAVADRVLRRSSGPALLTKAGIRIRTGS